MTKLFWPFAFALLVLGTACVGDDDDDLPAITRIGRADGWFVDAINSDYRAAFEQQLASVSDQALAERDTSRAGITAATLPRIEQATSVDDCDRDDTIFFLGNGAISVIEGAVACPAGEPSITDFFDGNVFSTDFAGTEFRLRRSDGTLVGDFAITRLDDSFVFRRTVSVQDSVIGGYAYDLEFVLRER